MRTIIIWLLILILLMMTFITWFKCHLFSWWELSSKIIDNLNFYWWGLSSLDTDMLMRTFIIWYKYFCWWGLSSLDLNIWWGLSSLETNIVINDVINNFCWWGLSSPCLNLWILNNLIVNWHCYKLIILMIIFVT